MENMKLISVRVDPKDLDKLDQFANDWRYRKRSDLIQAAIRLMIVACEKGQAEKVCRFCEGGAVCPPRAPPECFSWFYGLRP